MNRTINCLMAFLATGWCSVFYSQGLPVMERLPILERNVDMTIPTGVRSMVQIREAYNSLGAAHDTDTLSMTYYDEHGRRSQYVRFDHNKRQTTYFTEYPDSNHEVLFSYFKMDGYSQCKSISAFEYDDQKRRISATSSQVLDGQEEILNDNVYHYNELGLLTYQCALCNRENRIQYELLYEDTLLRTVYQFNTDTTHKSEKYDFVYDESGRLTYFGFHFYFNEERTFNQSRTYVYNADGFMIGATERHAFELGAIRDYKFVYNPKGQAIEKTATIGDMTSKTIFQYKNGLLEQTQTITNFPMLTGSGIWFSANAKHYGEKKTSQITEKWYYDHLMNPIRKEVIVDGILNTVLRVILEYGTN